MLLLTVFRGSEGFKDFDTCHRDCWFNLATTILYYGVYNNNNNNIILKVIIILCVGLYIYNYIAVVSNTVVIIT